MKSLSEEEIGRLFSVLLSELPALSFTEARKAIGAAGISDVSSPQYWTPFINAVDSRFRQLTPEGRRAAVRILADRLASRESVRTLFAQHGFEYVDGTFVPAALLDQREARYLPASSASELAKAMKRLVDGDETGAITSACGAVDTLMQQLYVKHGLGDPADFAFAAKINTAANYLRIFEDAKDELTSLGMKGSDADALVTDMRKAMNHAAQMLQMLRKAMGDVHGSKPALRQMAYGAIKWSSAICGLFEGR
jgi:hypothetical protein